MRRLTMVQDDLHRHFSYGSRKLLSVPVETNPIIPVVQALRAKYAGLSLMDAKAIWDGQAPKALRPDLPELPQDKRNVRCVVCFTLAQAEELYMTGDSPAAKRMLWQSIKAVRSLHKLPLRKVKNDGR